MKFETRNPEQVQIGTERGNEGNGQAEVSANFANFREFFGRGILALGQSCFHKATADVELAVTKIVAAYKSNHSQARYDAVKV